MLDYDNPIRSYLDVSWSCQISWTLPPCWVRGRRIDWISRKKECGQIVCSGIAVIGDKEGMPQLAAAPVWHMSFLPCRSCDGSGLGNTTTRDELQYVLDTYVYILGLRYGRTIRDEPLCLVLASALLSLKSPLAKLHWAWNMVQVHDRQLPMTLRGLQSSCDHASLQCYRWLECMLLVCRFEAV